MKHIPETQRYLTRDNLPEIGLWKSPRAKKHYNSRENDDLTVREVTQFALATNSEKAKIESLLIAKLRRNVIITSKPAEKLFVAVGRK